MTNLTDQFFTYDKRTQRAIIAAITNEECNAGTTQLHKEWRKATGRD